MPLLASFSALEPASIQTPTVAVSACGCDSVATVRPFERVEISVVGAGETTDAYERNEGRYRQKKKR